MFNSIIDIGRRLAAPFRAPRPAPSNLAARNIDPRAIAADVEYGLGSGRTYLYWLRSNGVNIDGAQVLEIGPGIAFGPMAYLTAYGVRVAVADRWLAPWEAGYHDRYYGLLAERLAAEDEGADATVVRRLADRGGYEGGPIETIRQPAESLDRDFRDRFDAVFSNAVLEHVADVERSLESCARITRPGGLGFHQIDFRDHRNFDRPLDHLLMNPEDFLALSKSAYHEYGSTRRREDYGGAFRKAGFEIVSHQSQTADDAYIAELRSKLERGSPEQRRLAANPHLADIGGFYVVKRSV